MSEPHFAMKQPQSEQELDQEHPPSIALDATSRLLSQMEIPSEMDLEGLEPVGEMKVSHEEIMSLWIDDNKVLAREIQELEKEYEALESMRYKGNTTIWEHQDNNGEGGAHGDEVQTQMAAIRGVVQLHDEHRFAVWKQIQTKRAAFRANEERLEAYKRSIPEP